MDNLKDILFELDSSNRPKKAKEGKVLALRISEWQELQRPLEFLPSSLNTGDKEDNFEAYKEVDAMIRDLKRLQGRLSRFWFVASGPFLARYESDQDL